MCIIGSVSRKIRVNVKKNANDVKDMENTVAVTKNNTKLLKKNAINSTEKMSMTNASISTSTEKIQKQIS
jgi:hypothetical protein